MPTTPPSPARATHAQHSTPDLGMRWLRFSGWLFVLLLLATAVVMGLGARLPATRTLAVTTVLAAPVDRVWQLLTDLPAQTTWRSGLDGIQPLNDRDGQPCWIELHGHLAIPLCVTASTPPNLRTVRTADPRLPLQGSWTFSLTAVSPASTRLTITETEAVPTLMWRFAMHYLRGDRTTLTRLTADLQTATTRRP